MPLIGIDSYIIDFLILESNDPKTIVLLDRSHYLAMPEKPMLEVTLPGFTGHIEVPYKINGITVLDSDTLGLTESCEYGGHADLPDGVYQIKMKVCPYDELFKKACYLKTQQLENKLCKLLVDYNNASGCLIDKDFRNGFLDIDILIRSAKAEIMYNNIENANQKYRQAFKKVEKLNNKINCR